MKGLFIILFLACSFGVSAQGFFGSIKKPKPNIAGRGVALSIDQLEEMATVKNEFRPIVNILSTGIQLNNRSGNTAVVALTGAGVSYQHLVWRTDTEKWNSVWSINLLAWYSRNITNAEDVKPFMYGVTLGLFDNKVMGGIATDGARNWSATLGFGIPLNNL